MIILKKINNPFSLKLTSRILHYLCYYVNKKLNRIEKGTIGIQNTKTHTKRNSFKVNREHGNCTHHTGQKRDRHLRQKLAYHLYRQEWCTMTSVISSTTWMLNVLVTELMKTFCTDEMCNKVCS